MSYKPLVAWLSLGFHVYVDSLCVLLCPEFMIPKDHQGAKSDAKAKEPLFELAGAQSPTCTDAEVRYWGERTSFKSTKVFWGLGAVGEVMAVASADCLGKSCCAGRRACFDQEV